MKKRLLLAVSLLAVLCLLTGCMSSDGLTALEGLFRSTAPAQTGTSSFGGSGLNQDTVVVSRAEYERLLQFSELADLMDYINEGFYQDADPEKMLEYAAKGLMQALDDPYSFYYNPEEWKEMWEEDEGNYVGIGVLINGNYSTQICSISRVFKGSPAEEAGVQRGDIIYRVGEDLYMTADNMSEIVSDYIRGQEGTDVEITFIRDGEEITLSIPRRQITVNQVESKMLNDQVGYIAMYEFSGKSDTEFKEALDSLTNEGAKGLIIDLRDNPGGWVNQAAAICDLFLDAGEVCYLVYKDGEESHGEYVTYDGKVDMQLVILINENSASSSEILTGALQDRAGATVVGMQSFGKGIVQIVSDIGSKGAGFQMTVASYYTPNGRAVHKIGITPDVEVPLPEGDNGMYDFADVEKDVQLQKALEVMMEKLQ